MKSHDPVSDPPSTLFSFEATGGAFNIIGVITLGGNAIDVDALAVNADQTLFGFEVSAVSQRSRLITIDRATATATARGPYLEGREIRGATITTAGRLLVIDTVANTVVEIGKQTGVPFGPEVELRYEGEAFDISSIADLVETDVGSLVLVWFNRFFALDAGTGQLELLHEDEVNGPDGVNVGAAGLAWLAVTPDGPRLAVYDVQWDDDIFGYDPANTFQRRTCISISSPLSTPDAATWHPCLRSRSVSATMRHRPRCRWSRRARTPSIRARRSPPTSPRPATSGCRSTIWREDR